MKAEDVAAICYEANKQLCESQGDLSFGPWEEAPEWQRKTILDGINFHLRQNVRPVPPYASHNNWLKHKRAEGWTYGPVKDPDKKQHPCMVSFDQLPKEQQVKDHLFGAIVAALEPFIDE